MKGDCRRVTLAIPRDLYMSLSDSRFYRIYGAKSFNSWLVWVLADWCRREKRRRKAWERRHGRKLGEPE